MTNPVKDITSATNENYIFQISRRHRQPSDDQPEESMSEYETGEDAVKRDMVALYATPDRGSMIPDPSDCSPLVEGENLPRKATE